MVQAKLVAVNGEVSDVEITCYADLEELVGGKMQNRLVLFDSGIYRAIFRKDGYAGPNPSVINAAKFGGYSDSSDARYRFTNGMEVYLYGTVVLLPYRFAEQDALKQLPKERV